MKEIARIPGSDTQSDPATKTLFDSIIDGIEAITQGEMIVVCDDEDRENEGDLVMAAELVTPDAVNFMASYGRGLICLPMSPEMIDSLEIPDMIRPNNSPTGTAFSVSIDAATGITTGISAADRARTVQVAVDPASEPEDLLMPGHMFPLRAKPNGVLQRAGHTEAVVDLARLADLKPAGMICEIMNDDGTMARVPDLRQFASTHGLKMVAVTQIIAYRRDYGL